MLQNFETQKEGNENEQKYKKIIKCRKGIYLKAKMSNIGNSNYTTIGGKVSKESLKINTAKETASAPAKATYKVWMEAYGGSASTTMSLIARAQNGKLTVKTS